MLSGFEIAGLVGCVASAGSFLAFKVKPKPQIEWFTDPELYDLRHQEIEAARATAIGNCTNAADLQKTQELFDDKIARVRLREGIR